MQHFEPNWAGRKPMNCKAFPNLGEPPCGPETGYLRGVSRTPALGMAVFNLWNKTGTSRREMLYVDNRRSGGSRDRRAYRVVAKWPQGVFKAATGPPSPGVGQSGDSKSGERR